MKNLIDFRVLRYVDGTPRTNPAAAAKSHLLVDTVGALASTQAVGDVRQHLHRRLSPRAAGLAACH